MTDEIFESAIPQLITDDDGHILKWNSAFRNLYDVVAPILTGISFNALIIPRDSSFLSEQFPAVQRGDLSSCLAPCRISIPGHISVEWWYLSLCRLSEDHLHMTFMPADDQISEAENLRREKDDAQESTKAKSLFLANMSHEIRTPIHTVRGMSELLMDTELDQEQSEYAAQINFSAEALLGLINDILDFSKIEAGKLEIEHISYDFHALLGAVLDMLSLEMYKRGLHVFLDMDDRMPARIYGDPTRIRQVLVNLLSNAMKFTKSGHITLKVVVRDMSSSVVRYRVEVRDTGIGIAEKKQQDLFSAFQQADETTTRNFGGTGLGLSICRSLVSLMGGTIGVKSIEGKGSTFHFSLASNIDNSQEVYNFGSAKQQLKILEDRTVVIVHNYKPAGVLLTKLLKPYAGQLINAEGGKAGLEILTSLKTDKPAVAIVDLQLGDMDGWQFASEVKSSAQTRSHKLFLVRPPGTMQADAKMKLLNWFEEYIIKPVKLPQFVDQLNRGLQDKEGMADENSEELEELEELSEVNPDEPLSVLLAEDHFVNQQLFQTILNRLGHRVEVAANGREVLEKYSLGSYDIIFMDMMMPEMDGYEATGHLRAAGADEPIIAVTANALQGEREKCLKLGMDGYISKPFSKDDLIQEIEKWRGRSHSSAQADAAEQPESGKKHSHPSVKISDAADLLPANEIIDLENEPQPGGLFTQSPEDLEIINYSKTVETFLKQEDFLRGVLKEFIQRSQGQLDQLERFILDDKLDDARIISHGIKGSSRNLSMARLGNAAAALEDANEQKNREQSLELFPAVASEFARVNEYLTKHLEI